MRGYCQRGGSRERLMYEVFGRGGDISHRQTIHLLIKETIAEDEGGAANVCAARGREIVSPHSLSMGGGGDRSSYSNSGKEDGHAEWMAAINSVISSEVHASNGASHQQKDENPKPKGLEHYQIKAGRLLEDLLDKTIEVVTEKAPIVEKDLAPEDVGVQLFRTALRGIVCV